MLMSAPCVANSRHCSSLKFQVHCIALKDLDSALIMTEMTLGQLLQANRAVCTWCPCVTPVTAHGLLLWQVCNEAAHGDGGAEHIAVCST